MLQFLSKHYLKMSLETIWQHSDSRIQIIIINEVCRKRDRRTLIKHFFFKSFNKKGILIHISKLFDQIFQIKIICENLKSYPGFWIKRTNGNNFLYNIGIQIKKKPWKFLLQLIVVSTVIKNQFLFERKILKLLKGYFGSWVHQQVDGHVNRRIMTRRQNS